MYTTGSPLTPPRITDLKLREGDHVLASLSTFPPTHNRYNWHKRVAGGHARRRSHPPCANAGSPKSRRRFHVSLGTRYPQGHSQFLRAGTLCAFENTRHFRRELAVDPECQVLMQGRLGGNYVSAR